MNESFWDNLDDLVASSTLRIDRPAGSVHPRYPDIVYPYDYGYLEGTNAGDGTGIDAWVGSAGRRVTAILCAADRVRRDAEIKLLVGCTPAQAQTILGFARANLQGTILVERPGAG